MHLTGRGAEEKQNMADEQVEVYILTTNDEPVKEPLLVELEGVIDGRPFDCWSVYHVPTARIAHRRLRKEPLVFARPTKGRIFQANVRQASSLGQEKHRGISVVVILGIEGHWSNSGKQALWNATNELGDPVLMLE